MIRRGWTIAGGLGTLLLLLTACKNDLDKVAAVEVPANAPDRITRQATYTITDSGRVRNRLEAGRIAEWTTGTRRTEITDGLRLDFVGPDGTVTSTLTARRGTILSDERRMEVNEQVVFINAQGERLETEQLTWLQDSARIHTDKPVRVQRGSDVVHGIGLDAAEDMSTYTIRQITGELYLPADDDHQAQ